MMTLPKPYRADDPHTVFLPAKLSKFLVEVAAGQVGDTIPPIPQPVSFSWGQLVIDADALTLNLEGTDLFLVVRNASHNVRTAIQGMSDETPLGEAKLSLPGERTIQARLASWVGSDMSIKDGVASSRDTIRLGSWILSPPGKVAAWIVPLREVQTNEVNLITMEGDDSWSQQLRVQGRYALHVIRRKKGLPPVLVVDTMGGEFDPQVFGLEARALEMSLGRNIPMDVALAIDAHGSVSGMAGLGFDHEEDIRRCPPLPKASPKGCWTAAFFQRFSHKLHQDGIDSPLLVASAAFLDALPARLDTAYLLLQVALEGFCKRIGDKSAAGGNLVADMGRWRAFVDAHRDEIVSLSTNEAAAKIFLNKLRDSAPQPPTSDKVKATFRDFGLNLPDEAMKEIGRRNRVAHEFAMSPEANRDWQNDRVRIDIIRTLLVAAISKYIGYHGAIAGWETDDQGWPQVPEWWAVGDEEEAARYYVADVSLQSDRRGEG